MQLNFSNFGVVINELANQFIAILPAHPKHRPLPFKGPLCSTIIIK